MPDRAEIIRYAERHGAKQAADQFGVSAGTIRSWRSRARKRQARNLATVGALGPTPAARFGAEVERILAWAAAVQARQPPPCLTCGGDGYVYVNSHQAKARNPAVAALKYATRLVCPDCGGPRLGGSWSAPTPWWRPARQRPTRMGPGAGSTRRRVATRKPDRSHDRQGRPARWPGAGAGRPAPRQAGRPTRPVVA